MKDDYKQELVELLTQLAKTGGTARQILGDMGIELETRWGLVTKLSFDEAAEELSIAQIAKRNALRDSYNELVKTNAHPRLYDWVVGSLEKLGM